MRPAIIVLTKSDLAKKKKSDSLANLINEKLHVLQISSLSGYGIEKFKEIVWQLIKEVE